MDNAQVEVTQEDREAAASVAVLVEMRDLILAGKADHHALPFAHHRIAAEQRGFQAAMQALRDDADQYPGTEYRRWMQMALKVMKAAISNMEPVK